MLKATGEPIVAVVGIACAIITQYLHPSLYALAGKSITTVSTPATVTTVTLCDITNLSHKRHEALQFILILLLSFNQTRALRNLNALANLISHYFM
jgi:hypothetical protein